jgi:hypothetical protein
MFRADANFRLIGGIEYKDGEWTKLAPSIASSLFAQQLDLWSHMVDANCAAACKICTC